MKIDTSFAIPMPPAQAWPLLLDVPAITPCVPGASLVEDFGDRSYRGKIALKVGPVQLQFVGDLKFVEIDDAQRRAVLTGKGADGKGRGNASANVTFTMHEESGGSRVDVVTDLNLTGAVAQYGRAEGLLKAVSNELTRQFTENLRRNFMQPAPVEAAPAEPAMVGDVAAPAPPAPPAAPPPVQSLSAFALLWAVVKSWFGGARS